MIISTFLMDIFAGMSCLNVYNNVGERNHTIQYANVDTCTFNFLPGFCDISLHNLKIKQTIHSSVVVSLIEDKYQDKEEWVISRLLTLIDSQDSQDSPEKYIASKLSIDEKNVERVTDKFHSEYHDMLIYDAFESYKYYAAVSHQGLYTQEISNHSHLLMYIDKHYLNTTYYAKLLDYDIIEKQSIHNIDTTMSLMLNLANKMYARYIDTKPFNSSTTDRDVINHIVDRIRC